MATAPRAWAFYQPTALWVPKEGTAKVKLAVLKDAIARYNAHPESRKSQVVTSTEVVKGSEGSEARSSECEDAWYGGSGGGHDPKYIAHI